jgi:hypothetical protein
MTKIMISNQSHKSYKKYKSENGRTRTSEYISGIRCRGGVSIPCWPWTSAMALFPHVQCNIQGQKLDPRCEINQHIFLFTYQLYRFVLVVYNDVHQFSNNLVFLAKYWTRLSFDLNNNRGRISNNYSCVSNVLLQF